MHGVGTTADQRSVLKLLLTGEDIFQFQPSICFCPLQLNYFYHEGGEINLPRFRKTFTSPPDQNKFTSFQIWSFAF